eukprot:XP_014070083.1 PREDICTED: multidrug and toxin extrusion protein 1-like [Salmo salar]
MIMLCVKWWTYELGGFLAGLISEVELGAQSVFELASICYMFPLGFSVAGSVRVGSALGAGDTEQAKLSAKLAMFCAGSVSVCLSVLVGTLKDKMSYVFTYDEQIREGGSSYGFLCPFSSVICNIGLWTSLFTFVPTVLLPHCLSIQNELEESHCIGPDQSWGTGELYRHGLGPRGPFK